MKWVLSLATLVLTVLVFEEEARQVAGDAQHAYGDAANQARDASQALSHKVEQSPLMAIVMAGGAGFLLALLTPRR